MAPNGVWHVAPAHVVMFMQCLCRCTCPSWWLRSCDQAVPSCLCPASVLWSSPWRDEWEWARSGHSPCLVWHAPHGCSTSCGTPGSPCPHGRGNGPSQWQPHHLDELEQLAQHTWPGGPCSKGRSWSCGGCEMAQWSAPCGSFFGRKRRLPSASWLFSSLFARRKFWARLFVPAAFADVGTRDHIK